MEVEVGIEARVWPTRRLADSDALRDLPPPEETWGTFQGPGGGGWGKDTVQ